MTNRLDGNTGPSNKQPPSNQHSDDASAATEVAGFGNRGNDHGVKEFTIKFEFEPKNANAAKKVTMVHTYIMKEMQTEFGDELIIFNNKNTKIQKINLLEWDSPVTHQRHFTSNTRSGSMKCRPKIVIIHRIHTTQSLSTIRNHRAIYDLLQENNCYMQYHAWDEKTWNTTLKGYCIGINPQQHYTNEQASLIIQNDFKSKNVKAPPFRLVYTSPNTIKYNHRKLRTKAYAIEVDFANSSAMNRALKRPIQGPTQIPHGKAPLLPPRSIHQCHQDAK
jgi:hypothetical protein